MQNKQQMASDLRRELMTSLRPRNVKVLPFSFPANLESGRSHHRNRFGPIVPLTEVCSPHGNPGCQPGNCRAADDSWASWYIPQDLLLKAGFSALIGQINDGRDFRDYVLEFSSKVPASNKRYSGPAVQNVYNDTPSAPVSPLPQTH